MLRLPLKDLLPSVPNILHNQIRASPYYAEKSDALVIQADSNRKQSDNVTACFTKLQDLILAAGRSSVKGETSPEQAERVKSLYSTPTCMAPLTTNVVFIARKPTMNPGLGPRSVKAARRVHVEVRRVRTTKVP